MKVVVIYARIYAGSFVKALGSIAKSPWTLLLPMALFVVLLLTGALLLSIPLIGPFALGFVLAALGSSYLYFVGEVVATGRVSLKEFRRSLGAYFWSVVNLMFVYWIASKVLDLVLRGGRNDEILWMIFELAVFILLNATPEVLYQKGTFGGIATIQRTMHFIQENWIEWFIPNLAIGAAAVAGWKVASQVLVMLGYPGLFLIAVLAGALLHVVMVFRGHLFQVLDGSSHRQRMFKYRSGV